MTVTRRDDGHMAEAGSLEMWRDTWAEHSRNVGAVAVSVVGRSRAVHLIESTIPASLAGGTLDFDPLATFVRPLLAGCSRADRRRAAAVLVGAGIPSDRAFRITGARSAPRMAGPPPLDGEPPTVSFERIVEVARTLTPTDLPSPERRRAKRRPRRLRVAAVLCALSVVGTGCSSSSGPADTTSAKAAPPPWKAEVTDDCLAWVS